jgi:hypothetical protein
VCESATALSKAWSLSGSRRTCFAVWKGRSHRANTLQPGSLTTQSGWVLAGLVGRSVRGKLRGSCAERRWQHLHVPGLHERSHRMRFPGHHGREEVGVRVPYAPPPGRPQSVRTGTNSADSNHRKCVADRPPPPVVHGCDEGARNRPHMIKKLHTGFGEPYVSARLAWDGVATYWSARLPCPGRYESIAAGACIIPPGLVLPAGYAQDRWPPWWGAFDGNGLHSGPVRRRTGQTRAPRTRPLHREPTRPARAPSRRRSREPGSTRRHAMAFHPPFCRHRRHCDDGPGGTSSRIVLSEPGW